MSEENIIEKIAALKKKRELLVTKRADHVAQFKASKAELKRLSEEASEKGWELKNLSSLLEEAKASLAKEVQAFESSLSEAEKVLATYEVSE